MKHKRVYIQHTNKVQPRITVFKTAMCKTSIMDLGFGIVRMQTQLHLASFISHATLEKIVSKAPHFFKFYFSYTFPKAINLIFIYVYVISKIYENICNWTLICLSRPFYFLR
jgi:hypothetical protein